MGERKVLNKYFPPDFDPKDVPRTKKAQDAQLKVRMMLPMSVRCQTCGTFMYKGTKFTTRKEDVIGEDYLGIQIFRFYYRCKHCSAEFTMKTDPKNLDYEVEHGATRNYEPWREQDRLKEELAKALEEEEKGDTMKQLENRTAESKRQMDITNALDEMIALRGRQGKVTTEEALQALMQSSKGEDEDGEKTGLTEEDEALVRSLMGQRADAVKRLEDDANDDRAGPSGSGRADAGAAGTSGADDVAMPKFGVTETKTARLRTAPGAAKSSAKSGPKLPVMAVAPRVQIAVKRKADNDAGTCAGSSKAAKVEEPAPEKSDSEDALGAGGAMGLLGGYGSSSGDEGGSD